MRLEQQVKCLPRCQVAELSLRQDGNQVGIKVERVRYHGKQFGFVALRRDWTASLCGSAGIRMWHCQCRCGSVWKRPWRRTCHAAIGRRGFRQRTRSSCNRTCRRCRSSRRGPWCTGSDRGLQTASALGVWLLLGLNRSWIGRTLLALVAALLPAAANLDCVGKPSHLNIVDRHVKLAFQVAPRHIFLWQRKQEIENNLTLLGCRDHAFVEQRVWRAIIHHFRWTASIVWARTWRNQIVDLRQARPP
ncbi:hypothetical protein BCR44DRAFT_1426442 [Catenaria anguillulae PL171]|uniref:Uncharacterized protein n=1 Tax=Catenaria anguillulae PL171 TaxID=765915 RepID=A0A1Y2HXM8_9FUNG|nr:hypothetical protein BCR44DRAFT_1426442 [Catenaria anguillulae PL171]